MPDLLLRDMKYLETYGCYPCRAVIPLQANKPLGREAVSFRVLRLGFDSTKKAQRFQEVPGKFWRIDLPKGDIPFDFSFDFQPGYYLLLASERNRQSALPVVVTDLRKPAKVAVIRPVFTQWSYHAKGFYSSNRRSFTSRILKRLGRLGPGGLSAGEKMREVSRRFNIQRIDREAGVFPAHSTVALNGFYCRNHRWDRRMWDSQFGQLEGLWVDEVLSGMPIFTILDKRAIPYHVFTDVDLHDQKEKLEAYRVLIFSGQEGMTSPYYRMMQRLQAGGRTSFLLWGVQGFGYRQLEYRPATGELGYVCTRGHQNLWGDALEERQPDWGDEADLFGFHFPEPSSASWRQTALFSQVNVARSDHPLVRLSRTSGQSFRYEVYDEKGQSHPGLTWAGGEFQRRVSPEASVIAHLDGDREVIGIGEYRNAVLFSPTYLPAYFAYQYERHPEVEAWFMATLEYLSGERK